MKRKTSILLPVSLTAIALGLALVLYFTIPKGDTHQHTTDAGSGDGTRGISLDPANIANLSSADIPQEAQLLNSEFIVPLLDAETLYFGSGEFRTLESADAILSGIQTIEIQNKELLTDTAVSRLRDTLAETVLGLMNASVETESRAQGFLRYAEAMAKNGDTIEPARRAALIRDAREFGLAVSEATPDPELFAAHSLASKSQPAWHAVNLEGSDVRVYSSAGRPADQPGYWLALLNRNIRSYNPTFKSPRTLESFIAEKKTALFADVRIVVERSAEWNYAVTPFFLRLWIDQQEQWHLIEANMVHKSPSLPEPADFNF